jgi:hypothetical protein
MAFSTPVQTMRVTEYVNFLLKHSTEKSIHLFFLLEYGIVNCPPSNIFLKKVTHQFNLEYKSFFFFNVCMYGKWVGESDTGTLDTF